MGEHWTASGSDFTVTKWQRYIIQILLPEGSNPDAPPHPHPKKTCLFPLQLLTDLDSKGRIRKPILTFIEVLLIVSMQRCIMCAFHMLVTKTDTNNISKVLKAMIYCLLLVMLWPDVLHVKWKKIYHNIWVHLKTTFQPTQVYNTKCCALCTALWTGPLAEKNST